MYVCICNAVTDRAIREAAQSGVSTLSELGQRTGCGQCCGSCACLAAEILASAHKFQDLHSRDLQLAIAA